VLLNSATPGRLVCRLDGVRIRFVVAPRPGLMSPVVPLLWAARVAGQEILIATTSDMTAVGAQAGLPVVDVSEPRRMGRAAAAVSGRADPAELPEEYRIAAVPSWAPPTPLRRHRSAAAGYAGDRGGAPDNATTAWAPPPAAALHYKIPQLVLPSFADNYLSAQPGGRRLHDLNPGSAPHQQA
jgi:hypothetical protein